MTISGCSHEIQLLNCAAEPAMSKNNMQGKTVLITGGARGMGAVTAAELARQGASIILVDWEGECATRTRDAINADNKRAAVEFIYCDLSSLAQVRELAQTVKAKYKRLDVLINNAGITDPVRRTSVDGYEMHLATCHLAHFLLTYLLLDLLKASAPARIICISSDAHKAGPGLDVDDFNNEKIWGKHAVSNNAAFKAYHRGKICNIYLMQGLAERLKPHNITINAVSPGYFINTTIHRNMTGIFKLGGLLVFGFGTLFGLNTPAKGARSHIYLASSDEAGKFTGKYIEHCQEKPMGKPAYDEQARAKLWEQTEQLLAINYNDVL